MNKEEWLKLCAARFMERVPSMKQDEADMLADVNLTEVYGGDTEETEPAEAADEELSNWDNDE